MINGTRAPFGPNFRDDAWTTTIANSNYNPLRVSLRHSTGRLSFLAAYTYSRSMDNASSLSDNALNANKPTAFEISFWLRHDPQLCAEL
jgi:hypothetical protein